MHFHLAQLSQHTRSSGDMEDIKHSDSKTYISGAKILHIQFPAHTSEQSITQLNILLISAMDFSSLHQAHKGIKHTKYVSHFQLLTLLTIFKSLGKSGLKISQVVLGAMSFGSVDKWTIPEEQALPIIKHAFDKGLNTWDTVSTTTLYSFTQLEAHSLFSRPMSTPSGNPSASLAKHSRHITFLVNGL